MRNPIVWQIAALSTHDLVEIFSFLFVLVFCAFVLAMLWRNRESLLNGQSFLYSYFLVSLGFGQRYLCSVSGDVLAERMANIEWATNMQNALCFTAVVCALHVLYNQRAA